MTTTQQPPAATREAFGPTLVRLAQEGLDIVVCDADLGVSTTAATFGKAFPQRFFTLGPAEANMIGIAAGLAAEGKVAWASTFAVFMPGRCFDQIRVSVAQPNLNVKLFASHGGISVGEDGISAQAIEDLALMCSLLNFTVVVPADVNETASAVEAASRAKGPFYIRAGRPKIPVIYEPGHKITLGKADRLREGRDVTIVASGIMVKMALDAAATLAERGIEARVLNMSTLRPLDGEALERAARETGAIVTAEEHLVHCGLGALVAQHLAARAPVPMGFVGMKDRYAESGRWDELLQKYDLTPDAIVRECEAVVRRKA
ncbi:MAG TPA: transketolase C-terminal domain-containing protein [Dehalococcoidia bacterium]|nr:transketolase C-terminal domain-containing protein [Dehalococcoidia bacterium]